MQSVLRVQRLPLRDQSPPPAALPSGGGASLRSRHLPARSQLLQPARVPARARILRRVLRRVRAAEAAPPQSDVRVREQGPQGSEDHRDRG